MWAAVLSAVRISVQSARSPTIQMRANGPCLRSSSIVVKRNASAIRAAPEATATPCATRASDRAWVDDVVMVSTSGHVETDARHSSRKYRST